MPIPRPDIIRILLPVILRLCPELRVGEIVKGKVIPISNVNPLNEAQEARNLSRKFERPKRSDGRKDSSEVINLDTAIKIIEKYAGNGNIIAKVLRDCVVTLIAGGTGTGLNVTEKLMNPLITELRENTLRQNTPRVLSSRPRLHRPSKGHGHGRHPNPD